MAGGGAGPPGGGPSPAELPLSHGWAKGFPNTIVVARATALFASLCLGARSPYHRALTSLFIGYCRAFSTVIFSEDRAFALDRVDRQLGAEQLVDGLAILDGLGRGLPEHPGQLVEVGLLELGQGLLAALGVGD